MFDNNEKDIQNKPLLYKIAETTAAIGAGALLLNKGLGGKFLSDIGTKSAAAYKALNEDFTTKSFKDINYDTLYNMAKNRLLNNDSTWNTAESKLEINSENGSDLFSVFAENIRMRNNPRNALQDIFDSRLLEGTKQDFMKTYGGSNEENQYKIRNFVDDVVKNFNDITEGVAGEDGIVLNKERLGETLKGTSIGFEDQQKMFEEIMKRKTESDADLKLALDNSGEHRDLIQDMADKMIDRESLVAKFGARGEKDSFLNKVLDNQATLQEVLNNRDKIKDEIITIKHGDTTEDINIVDYMQRFIEEHPEYANINVGKDFKTNQDGEVYSNKILKNAKNKILDEAAGTIPGKIFKIRDFLYKGDQPFYHLWRAGEHDINIGRIEKAYMNNQNLTDKDGTNTLLLNNYVKIHDKTYRINNNELEHISDLDNIYLINAKHGTQSRLIKDIMGRGDYLETKNHNKLFSWFDMFSTPEANKLDIFKAKASKFSDSNWIRNVIKDMFTLDPREAARDFIFKSDFGADANKTYEYFKKLKTLNKWMANHADNLNHSTLLKLKGHSKNKSFIDVLLMDDKDMIKSLTEMSKTKDAFLNHDLYSMVVKHLNDPRKAYDTLSITQDRTLLGETKAHRFYNLLRREAHKEFFLKEIQLNGDERSSLNRLLNNANITGRERDKTLFLAHWGILQSTGNLYNRGISQRNKLPELSHIKSYAYKTFELFNLEDKYYEGDFYKEFRHNITKMSKEYSSLLEAGEIKRKNNIVRGGDFGEWTSMQRPFTPKDILSNLNDSVKFKASTKSFAKQFIAGRNNPENITTMTLLPYFTLNRLLDPLASSGLSFSAKYKGSTLDLAYYMMTRRILPVMIGATYLSYANDMSRQFLGNTFKGMFIQGTANVNIGLHKFTDATGLTAMMQEDRRSNVISQYWFRDDEYKNWQDKKYEQMAGYTPVRAGRWWAFGSSSEFRGGKIQYFQPNALIRERSNWYNTSVYGSTWNKWNHSWLPTPTSPLAPIIKILDPYYLEKLHYKDRPYPITGKMFSDYTPWGPFLNATVGEVLKPQVKMHGSELGGTLTDVRDLIANRNRAVMQRANQNKNLIQIDNKFNTIPVSFTSTSPDGSGDYNAVTDVQGYYDMYSAANRKGVTVTRAKSSTNASTIGSSISIARDSDSFIGGIISGIMPRSNSTTDYIAPLNFNIKSRASARGIITPDTIFTAKASGRADVLYNKEAMADIRNTSPANESIKDTLYSAQQILGIYGFVFNSLMPTKPSYRLADAGAMDSFSNRFWNNSVGGHGGEFMEIARRFFPHESHAINRVNPLRNMMPDWIPDHFKHGDPYAKLPHGDYRLPGKGYEAMYKLHPDDYGRYGAYDRMKILADIAPWSPEYKTWRQIASQTIQNPILRRQMQEIQKRVERQSKIHDFYNYKFIGAGKVDTISGHIDKILENGTFTLTGDNKTYKLAGVHIRGNLLSDYLNPGQRVELKVNSNKYYRGDNDTTKAAVFAGGENIGFKLIKSKKAQEDTGDDSPASVNSRFSNHAITRGKLFEAIGHAPIPYIHNKFLRIETPFESWQRHEIYGSSFSTWEHPIQGFIMPSLNTQFSYGPIQQGISVASIFAARYIEKQGIGKIPTIGLKLLQYSSNPASFIGGMSGYLLRTDKKYLNIGEDIGAAAGLLGYGYTHLDKPVDSAVNFAALGYLASKQLKLTESEFAPEILKLAPHKAAAVGAVVGLGLSGLKRGGFNKDKMFGPYIPEHKRKVWENQEYYDRLKYIKYMGLYKKAARKAFWTEGVDVTGLMDLLDRRKKEYDEKKEELLLKAQKISNIYAEGDVRRQKYLNDTNVQLAKLSSPQAIINAGKYTRSAIAYKFAAESTIYGLKDNATWSQLLRAIPKNDRDYFIEFAKEKDPKKQKEILKYVSPYERKVLEIAWGEKVHEPMSNKKFFRNHFMPGTFWSGWRPDTNLDDVQIKEIKNEGQLLADYGYYDSQADSPEARVAPSINMHKGQSSINMLKDLTASLQGAGLVGVDVSIYPSTKPGIQMITDIVRMGTYEVKDKLNLNFGRIFF